MAKGTGRAQTKRERRIRDFELAGEVIKVSGNNNYLVEVSDEKGNKRKVLCYLSGDMRRYTISVLLGDKVRVVVPPPFDRGRIVFRDK